MEGGGEKTIVPCSSASKCFICGRWREGEKRQSFLVLQPLKYFICGMGREV